LLFRAALTKTSNEISQLRITVSAIAGILCLLLIALWVRSYWRADLWLGRLSATRMLHASSQWVAAILILGAAFGPTRFSLRTLLVAITIVAVLLGFAVWATAP
jgi:hypothetical protein